MLTSMPNYHIASILSSLVAPLAVVDGSKDNWMPGGFLAPEEAKLGECEAFLTPEIREQLTSWWLRVRRGANTPNWDLVSTCTVEGQEGLILVEAKAYDSESRREGKSPGNPLNDQQIFSAIEQANEGLNDVCPGWAITRDSHYQLCNRFAWAWKVASFGVPVILIYLGFLHADEMLRRGKPFVSLEDWRSILLKHGKSIIPEDAWERRLETNGAPMWTMIRSLDLKWVVSERVTA
jgi:hypothetical protein